MAPHILVPTAGQSHRCSRAADCRQTHRTSPSPALTRSLLRDMIGAFLKRKLPTTAGIQRDEKLNQIREFGVKIWYARDVPMLADKLNSTNQNVERSMFDKRGLHNRGDRLEHQHDRASNKMNNGNATSRANPESTKPLHNSGADVGSSHTPWIQRPAGRPTTSRMATRLASHDCA